MRQNTHVLKWTEWDGVPRQLEFPSAEAAEKVWRSLSRSAGMSVLTWLIEPIEGVQS